MINEEFLKKSILECPVVFGLESGMRETDIRILLRAPETESSSGRLRYFVYFNKSKQPSLIAQTSLTGGKSGLSGQNPYIPPEELDRLDDVLPHPAGELSNAGRKIYWAKYIPWQSLRAEFRNVTVLQKVVERLTKAPWKEGRSNGSPEGLMHYIQMSKRVCSLLEDLRPLEDALLRLFQEHWPALKFGFSHGDLWSQDILCSADDRLCFLDWEWYSPMRPMGYDLFQLAVGTLECGYLLTTSEALTQLIYGVGEQEKIFRQYLYLVWDEMEYNQETRYTSVLAYLVDIQNQMVEQAPRSPSRLDLEAARALAISLCDKKYLAPLLKELSHA